MKITENFFRHATKVFEKNGYFLYEYRPTLFRPLLVNFDHMRLVRRCRYLLDYLKKGKYRVYYLVLQKDCIAFCVVSPGGRALVCATEKDIVLGPYYVERSKRGNGYSKVLIRLVLDNCGPYRYAYDWILKTNTPSRRASLSCGFQETGELNIIGLLRKPVLVEKGGAFILYRYEKEQQNEANYS